MQSIQKIPPQLEVLRRLPLQDLRDLCYLESGLLPLMGTYDPFDSLGRPGQDFGLRIWQYAAQFAPYLLSLSEEKITSYLEIGLQWGGSFAFTVEYLSRFTRIERAIGVDVNECPLSDAYVRPGVHFLAISSHAPEFATALTGQAFDLVLIDGDHTYESVRADYELVSRICRPRFIVFHDIVNVECPDVVRLWNELKANPTEEGDEFREYIAQPLGRERVFGIGVIVRRR